MQLICTVEAAWGYDQGHRARELAPVLEFLERITEDRVLFVQVRLRPRLRGVEQGATGGKEGGEQGGEEGAHRREEV